MSNKTIELRTEFAQNIFVFLQRVPTQNAQEAQALLSTLQELQSILEAVDAMSSGPKQTELDLDTEES